MSKQFVESQEKECPPLVIRMPAPLRRAMDEHVEATDTDRSKFARSAIREKLARDGRRTKSGK